MKVWKRRCALGCGYGLIIVLDLLLLGYFYLAIPVNVCLLSGISWVKKTWKRGDVKSIRAWAWLTLKAGLAFFMVAFWTQLLGFLVYMLLISHG